MRYIIKNASAADAEKAVILMTYAAVFAETPQEAAALFVKQHPDRTILAVEAAGDEHKAFERCGMGSWTDEEQAQHRKRLSDRYDHLRDEHAEARARVECYSLAEFSAEQEYAARRASEETPNAEGVHVGDIFVACWGYDQTNYDFYQVIQLRGKHTAVVRENAVMAEMCSDYNGYKRPIRDHFKGDETYTLRTTYDEYHKCAQMKVPGLSGNRHMQPAEYGKLYEHSTGA